MKTFASDLFGTIPEPTAFQQIIELALARRRPDDFRTVRMWRGQGDIRWPLHSTAYRRLCLRDYSISGGDDPDEQDIRFYEKHLLEAADHKGYRFYEGRRLSDFDLLARLRHHGAATRMIDATRSMMVALWFCATSEPQEVGLLIGIHTDFLGGEEGEAKEGDYDDIVERLSEYDHPLTWEPSPNSPRVAAQHSQFLYSELSNEIMGSLRLPKDEGAVLAIAITPALKAESKKILSEAFDIGRATLFPDFDGFSGSRGVDVDPRDDHRW